LRCRRCLIGPDSGTVGGSIEGRGVPTGGTTAATVARAG
jgi:hypothetical protein